MANNIRDLTDATGRRMADALEHLSGSGKSDAKFPNIDGYDLFKLVVFAGDHAHIVSNEINVSTTPGTFSSSPLTTGTTSPLNAFLIGLEHMSDFDTSDEGRVAYVSFNFMRLMMLEASRFNLNSLLKFTDGLLTQISKCPVIEVSNEHMPSGSAFLIISARVAKGLNELDTQGKLHDEEALMALLHANADGLYYHGGQPILKNLDVTVTPVEGGKLRINFGETREKSTNNLYIITAATMFDLPDANYGTAVDPTTGPWAGAGRLAGSDTPADQTEFEYTLPNGHTEDTAVHIVELLRNMKPIGNRKIEIEPIA